MLDIIRDELKNYKSEEDKFNHLRENLQVLILKIIYDSGLSRNVSFTGGTALRIIFNLRRFSEDVDFSLVENKGYSLEVFSDVLKTRLAQYNFKVELTAITVKTVHKYDIKFVNLFSEFGMASMPGQKLYIKMEIDTNPPAGGKVEISVINKLFMFSVSHFDKSSMFATKLHACFFRKYTKGRDYYDLMWYLTKKIEPNYLLLNNAARQTQKDWDKEITKANLKDFLVENISKVDFNNVKKDVERFLEDKKEMELLTKDNFVNAINNYS